MLLLRGDTMSNDELSSTVPVTKVDYRYMIMCKDQTITLEVDERDMFYNADDELDCPLDVVLRKNEHTLNDLMTWDPREVAFVELINNEPQVIRKIQMNINI